MRKILIVEDEAEIANILADILRPICDEPPLIALTMEGALAYIGAGTKFDLITLDLRMPGWNAVETLAKIREIQEGNGDGLVIVVSGVTDPNIEAESMAAGAHGFIPKPAVAFRDTFLSNLRALALSLIRQPTKYQQNLKIAEMLVQKLTAGESDIQSGHSPLVSNK